MSLWWNGHVTQTTAVVCVQSDVTATVDVNGVTAQADTAVDDGNVALTLTGLEAGQAYPYTIRIGGDVLGTGEVRTAPAPGQSFSVIAFSCLDQAFDWYWPNVHTQHDVRAVIALGDWPYLDVPLNGNAISYWGLPATQGMSFFLRDNPAATEAQQRANYWMHCKQARSCYGLRGLLTHAALYANMDDHEYIGNNLPYQAGSVGNGGANNYHTIFANDAAAAAFANLCEDWLQSYWKGHPANTDAGADPTKPWLYYRFRLGDAEFWTTNSYRWDNKTTTNLGTTQRQWLIDTIQASTAPYKVWMLTPGGTGFPGVPAELDTILAAVAGYGLTVVIVGDFHMPHASRRSDVTFINTSPAGTGSNIGVANSGSGNVVWHAGKTGDAAGFFLNHARIDISPASLRVSLVDPAGNDRAAWAFLPSGGGPVVPRQRVG